MQCLYAECCLCFVVLPSVVILTVIIPSIVYAECRYSEYHCSDSLKDARQYCLSSVFKLSLVQARCRNANCHYSKCLGANLFNFLSQQRLTRLLSCFQATETKRYIEISLNHRHLSNLDCLMVHTALPCLID